MNSASTSGSSYELLDFGNAGKLERFADVCVDRPCPAAVGPIGSDPKQWQAADLHFSKSGDRGRWKKRKKGRPTAATQATDASTANSAPWTFNGENFQLLLDTTPFGHVGVFPEQAPNWQRIQQRVSHRLRGKCDGVRLLNLFAYTGGSSLAAAAAGAEVVHVDSAKANVQRARENATLSGLAAAPMRWIVEDARRFVDREIRRGNRYEAIVLDPPSYGHGPKGETWKMSTDLMPLLNDCKRLLSDSPLFVLLSCHSPGFGPPEVGASLQQAIFGHCQGRTETFELGMTTQSGRKLPAGVAAIALFA